MHWPSSQSFSRRPVVPGRPSPRSPMNQTPDSRSTGTRTTAQRSPAAGERPVPPPPSHTQQGSCHPRLGKVGSAFTEAEVPASVKRAGAAGEMSTLSSPGSGGCAHLERFTPGSGPGPHLVELTPGREGRVCQHPGPAPTCTPIFSLGREASSPIRSQLQAHLVSSRLPTSFSPHPPPHPSRV